MEAKNGKSAHKKTSSKTSANSKSSKTKKAKVVVPKMNNVVKPQSLSLEEWQVALRQQQAEKEVFAISQVDEEYCPGEYKIGNAITRNEYKVVYRGRNSMWNYCSCMDFKTSQLGTCKHLEAVKLWVKKKKKKVHREQPSYSSVYIDYKGPRSVKIRFGETCNDIFKRLAKDYFDGDGVLREEAYDKFDIFLHAAKAIDENFRCYGDALDFIISKREKSRRLQLVESKYSDETLDSLLKARLYPYQKEGIRFAVKAGKAIIADEMGLGKTIQAIAASEIYLREGMADNVLVVCPTSLKYQWKKEIEKFTGGDMTEVMDEHSGQIVPVPKVIVIEGSPFKRQRMYMSSTPYKIVSYNTVCNDIREMGRLSVGVLVMDEIQRLKNWDTQISRAARKIDSDYAVLLSGTPLENKLEELYANMELVDQFCLGPYYKFKEEHILLDQETGKIIGYRNLNAIGEQIREKLLRRTKKGVQLQLPKRSDQYLLVPMTSAQADYHTEFKWELTKILNKYNKFHYMSEQDRRRLMLLLSQMRMVADSTFILEQDLKKRQDVKIAEVMNLLDNVFANGDEKVVIFSEWERMARLVAIELEKRGIRFEFLNGSIPAKQRGRLVENFTTLPESRVFISTDAGSTGLNLQVASILINLDLPWNPAVLEQRIARIYRLGQERPVQILNLVSKDSIEEGMIAKLKFKTSMFEGVLDGGEDSVFVSDDKFKKFMDDLSCVMDDTPKPPAVEYADNETEEQTAKTADNEETKTKATEHAKKDTVTESDDDSEVLKDLARQSSPFVESHIQTLDGFSDHDVQPTPSHGRHTVPSAPSDPRQLISQGVSFLTGLAETLKSEEATRQLVDNIVEVDEKTGEVNVKIPVASKETVMQLFSLLGKLM
ncbi:MAG: DEAD/DEAH box helicase [Bacteroidaceae bacterium]|nr:DEAD/DEAH box helicase [Bacteroidaceae bacterium]